MVCEDKIVCENHWITTIFRYKLNVLLTSKANRSYSNILGWDDAGGVDNRKYNRKTG